MYAPRTISEYAGSCDNCQLASAHAPDEMEAGISPLAGVPFAFSLFEEEGIPL